MRDGERERGKERKNMSKIGGKRSVRKTEYWREKEREDKDV